MRPVLLFAVNVNYKDREVFRDPGQAKVQSSMPVAVQLLTPGVGSTETDKLSL